MHVTGTKSLSYFVVQYFVSFLALQSSLRRRERERDRETETETETENDFALYLPVFLFCQL